MRVVYKRQGVPVQVEWRESQNGDLVLYLDNQKQNLSIKLAKNGFSESTIVAFKNGHLCGSDSKYRLGHFKKRMLDFHFKIKQGYEVE